MILHDHFYDDDERISLYRIFDLNDCYGSRVCGGRS